MRFFKHVTILHGCAVGGGSITYATTLLRPPDKVWDMGSWAGLADWKAEMPRHYDSASRMLGVVENKILGPADRLLKQAADRSASAVRSTRPTLASFRLRRASRAARLFPIHILVAKARSEPPAKLAAAAWWAAAHGAKNTLDLNYLYLAEKHGAQVFPETKVVDVKPLDGALTGAGDTKFTR